MYERGQETLGLGPLFHHFLFCRFCVVCIDTKRATEWSWSVWAIKAMNIFRSYYVGVTRLLCLLLWLKIPEQWVPGKGSIRKECRYKHHEGDDREEDLCGKVMGIAQG